MSELLRGRGREIASATAALASSAAAADVASGKLVSVEPKRESTIVTSTGVELLSAAGDATKLQSEVLLS